MHRHKGVAPGAEPAHSSRRRTPDMLKLSKLPLPAACGPSLGGSSQSITTPRRSGGLPLLRPMVTVGTSWGGCLEIHSGIYPELPWMGWHHRHLHPRRPGSQPAAATPTHSAMNAPGVKPGAFLFLAAKPIIDFGP